MVLSLDPDHDTVAGYSRDLGGAVVMGHHRWFLAVLVCACLLDPSISYAAELEGEEGAAAPELSQAETVLDDPVEEAHLRMSQYRIHLLRKLRLRMSQSRAPAAER